MLRKYLNRKLNANDHAISPVIGTILMIAATVIIAGAVYAAVNIYGGKSAKQTVDAAWKAQAIDTDGDGLEDAIKVTYLNGPDHAATGTVTESVRQANGTALSGASAVHQTAGEWNAGDYQTFSLQYGVAPGQNAAAVLVSVAQSGNTMLDQSLQLRE